MMRVTPYICGILFGCLLVKFVMIALTNAARQMQAEESSVAALGQPSPLREIEAVRILTEQASRPRANPIVVPDWRERLLDAIEQVESGGRGARTPDGDGGRAIGPFQIWEAYWIDAVEYDENLRCAYQDCRRPDMARRVVIAYLTRYDAWTSPEKAARVHNGGPRGHLKATTLPYWERVKEAMR